MSMLTPGIGRKYPDVLGITANISVNDLVSLTNQQRIAAGLSPLTLDSQLSQAASNKASDMFAKNYWAHTAPDGATPWSFIKSAGYDYLYAGENLARGFTTAPDALNAWMASPGHKENILSSKYKDVGFAVATGTLSGDDTILIVEEFGERLGATPSVSSPQSQTAVALSISPTEIPQPTYITQANILPSVTPIPTIIPTTVLPSVLVSPEVLKSEQPIYIASSVERNPVINEGFLAKNFAIAIISFFIFLFVLDMIVIERKKIIRLVSHSIDHILFLSIVLLGILLYSKGLIL
jgi:hypothetical protein